MRAISFTEFRKNASSILTEVENGEVYQLIRHGRPVAELSPIGRGEASQPAWKKPALKLTARGASLSAAILNERDSGR